ncbi:MAG: hypothetical protein LBT33_01960, partial [Spirochaetia bacterium]|nr:hypothetical protein [Spirochaetia bacterium]
MADILEAFMVICFGISWPANIINSWKVRTAKGKSLVFLIFIAFGYLCGILAKIISWNITYVLLFYLLNAVLVVADIFLYFRNRRLDRERIPPAA